VSGNYADLGDGIFLQTKYGKYLSTISPLHWLDLHYPGVMPWEGKSAMCINVVGFNDDAGLYSASARFVINKENRAAYAIFFLQTDDVVRYFVSGNYPDLDRLFLTKVCMYIHFSCSNMLDE
jgi:hypothetical protein